MENTIRQMLLGALADLDAGNCNISNEKCFELIESYKDILQNKKEEEEDSILSKYAAARRLNISRATFDNYVSQGKLPKGKKKQGFKELIWFKEDIDKFKNSCKS